MQSYSFVKGTKGLKSPITRFGDKYFLVDRLIKFIPYHKVYVEVFCGASHLLFAKTPSPVEVINDVDNHLISFFKVIKDPVTRQRLIEVLNYMPYARGLWQEFRAKWKQGFIPDDGIERAAIWFYLNKATFSGDQENGGFALPSITGRNPAQSFRTAIDGIEAVSRRLRNVTIECLDYRGSIRRYDSPDTLFYIDPPYMQAEHYYGAGFGEQDHYTLAELLHDIKGKAMVSHYANPVYDELYRGWYRQEYVTFKGSHKVEANTEKPKTTEVLYCNFEPRQREIKIFENG